MYIWGKLYLFVSILYEKSYYTCFTKEKWVENQSAVSWDTNLKNLQTNKVKYKETVDVTLCEFPFIYVQYGKLLFKPSSRQKWVIPHLRIDYMYFSLKVTCGYMHQENKQIIVKLQYFSRWRNTISSPH